jgi:hypothetical protein
MTQNYLLLGLLLLLLVSLTFRVDPPSPHVAFTVSHEVKQAGDSDTLKSDYPFLNEGLEYTITSREEFIFPADLSEGTYIVYIRSKSESQLEMRLSPFYWSYLIDGKPTTEQLRLMEYDVLIRASLLRFNISVQFMNDYHMNEEQFIDFGRRLCWGWVLSRKISYPPAVAKIHEIFLEATEWVSLFIGEEPGDCTPNTTTITIRVLSIYAPGGGPAGGYNSSHSLKLFAQATLALLGLLETNGIHPY